MMKQQLNTQWMQDVLSDDKSNVTEGPKLDWVQNGKGFKKNIKFKVVAPNNKENNIFSWIVGTHWNLGPDENKRIICTEHTTHLKNLGIECPICALKRKLLAAGFEEADLCKSGKFGPIPKFDPTITSNVKVVVLDSDSDNIWDNSHISILQQKGVYLTRWLIEKYMDNETPDFLAWDMSNVIRFSRASETAKWDREISFSTFSPTPEIKEKLLQENDQITLSDVWKAPTEEELSDMRTLAEEIFEEYMKAKQTLANPSEEAVITEMSSRF